MNPETFKEACDIAQDIATSIKNINLDSIQIAICPPLIWIFDLKKRFQNMDFGSQDVFFENKGAYTGQISPLMLKDMGVKYALIGHSEKRRLCHEESDVINKKIKACLNHDITPIHIIGDLNANSIEEEDFEIINQNLQRELINLSQDQIKKIIFAYEPVFAISKGLGTGKAVPLSHATQTIKFLRNSIAKNFDLQASDVKILYGGSADSQNGPLFLANEDINGLLLGGASLVPREFIKIIENCQ